MNVIKKKGCGEERTAVIPMANKHKQGSKEGQRTATVSKAKQ